MSVVLMPVDTAATAHAMRVLPIITNLLPPEIVDARRARRAQRTVLTALVVFAVLLCGWYGVAAYQTSIMDTELDRATAEIQQVRVQQQQYGEVTRVQGESRAITDALSAVIAEDLQWSELFPALRAPADRAGIQISKIAGELAPVGGAPGAVPSAVSDRTVGTVTITGSGTSKTQVADYVRTLATVPNVANPLLGSVIATSEAVNFTVTIDVTAGALSGRYLPEKSTTPPGER